MATYALLALSHAAFTPLQTAILFAVGTLAGEAPDLDLIRFSLEQRSDKKAGKTVSHRDYFTHAPLFWLAASLTVVIVGLISGFIFTQFVGWTILCGSISHFILDSIEFGIAWLWPFSKKRIFLREMTHAEMHERPGTLRHYWEFFSEVYVRNLTFYAEILITLPALYMALH
ncbi:MAG: hypothetical protein QOG91_696 [Candidatus Parcubacteria bacterium]|nr:hypothetical protein [Candidatus Parcubacteria bacterium]